MCLHNNEENLHIYETTMDKVYIHWPLICFIKLIRFQFFLFFYKNLVVLLVPWYRNFLSWEGLSFHILSVGTAISVSISLYAPRSGAAVQGCSKNIVVFCFEIQSHKIIIQQKWSKCLFHIVSLRWVYLCNRRPLISTKDNTINR